MSKASGPRIAIRYCTQCHWLLRAAWMAQELLSTFGTDLGEVSLQPGTGGVFVITYDGEVIWERKTDGGFPDVKQLKQRVRDHLDPDRDLGHLDRLPIDQGVDSSRRWAMVDYRIFTASPLAPYAAKAKTLLMCAKAPNSCCIQLLSLMFLTERENWSHTTSHISHN